MKPKIFCRLCSRLQCRFLLLVNLALLLLQPIIHASSSENVYKTSSYGQLVSSSTLRWKAADSSGSFYRKPSVIRDSGSSVCRGWHQSLLLAGSTDPLGRCAVGFFGKRHRLHGYQVLVDSSSASRLEWRYWDIFTEKPIGMVAFTEQEDDTTSYVARVRDDRTGKYRYGDLNPRRGLSGDIAIYKSDHDVRYETKGEVLVEVDPVKYVLEDVEYVTRRAKIKKEELHLGSRILANELSSNSYEYEGYDLEDWGTIRSVIAYNATYHYYWGQLEGLIKALPAQAQTFSQNKKITFKWALPLSFERHRILEVSSSLQVGTSVQVSASALRTTTEVPYTAKLVSVFAEGKRKVKPINGTYLETLLSDVRTDYGRPYFTRNGTFAPTTTSSTTSSTTSTTATPTKRSATKEPATKQPTLRPKRTTTPLPTRPNPLLRFYPQIDRDEDELQGRASPDKEMQSDQATKKRSPVTESLVNKTGVTSPHALLFLLPLYVWLTS